MMAYMGWKPVEFYVSNIGGDTPRVVARFTRRDGRVYMERFDRLAGRWVPDSTLAGYDLGFDDWAERSNREDAAAIIASWGFDPALVDAPVTVTATT
jgi:predicted ATP-grasp superfamily ATP-dependent carboligase